MLYAALDEGKAGFLGAEHFGCISRMLGYQGVAMCGDEMLKTLSSQVGDYSHAWSNSMKKPVYCVGV